MMQGRVTHAIAFVSGLRQRARAPATTGPAAPRQDRRQQHHGRFGITAGCTGIKREGNPPHKKNREIINGTEGHTATGGPAARTGKHQQHKKESTEKESTGSTRRKAPKRKAPASRKGKHRKHSTATEGEVPPQ